MVMARNLTKTDRCRTLVNVTQMDERIASIRVPALSNASFDLPLSEIPQDVRGEFCPGYAFFATIDLSAPFDDLRKTFEGFERTRG
jgi:hypothetical protein